MKSKSAWFLILAALLIPAVCGCGSGGGDDVIYICYEQTDHWVSEFGTISSDLSGSYFLSGFEWDTYTVLGNRIRTITEKDFSSAWGYMDVGALDVLQHYAITGSAYLMGEWYLTVGDETNTYTKGSVSWVDSNTGTVILDGFEMPFATSGDVLTINWPFWCSLLEEAPKE